MTIIEVKDSGIKGKGVFATDVIGRGQVIFAIDDSFVIDEDNSDHRQFIGAEPDHCDYLADGTVVLMQEPECYINHSCDPNVYIYAVGGNRFVLAMHTIAAGEELAFDYAINIVNGDWLDCRCGAANCRGRHRPDFFLLPNSRQLEYLPYLETEFAQMHTEKILALLQQGKRKARCR